jgi:hypothetical protein
MILLSSDLIHHLSLLHCLCQVIALQADNLSFQWFFKYFILSNKEGLPNCQFAAEEIPPSTQPSSAASIFAQDIAR